MALSKPEGESIKIGVHDLHWMAGLLEGEGSFYRTLSGNIRAKMSSVDLDVVERIARLTGTKPHGPYIPRNPRHQAYYMWYLDGRPANDFMLLLLPLMSSRRRMQIAEAIEIG